MSRKKFTRISQKRNSTKSSQSKKENYHLVQWKDKKYKGKATPPTLKIHILFLPSFDLIFWFLRLFLFSLHSTRNNHIYFVCYCLTEILISQCWKRWTRNSVSWRHAASAIFIRLMMLQTVYFANFFYGKLPNHRPTDPQTILESTHRPLAK